MIVKDLLIVSQAVGVCVEGVAEWLVRLLIGRLMVSRHEVLFILVAERVIVRTLEPSKGRRRRCRCLVMI